MTYKVFTETDLPLTADDINNYLMNQTVIRCTATTRPEPAYEGMHTYDMDTGEHHVYRDFQWVRTGAQTQYLRKLADESVTNSAIPQTDDHLTATVAPYSIYDVTLRAKYASPTAADIRIGLNMPAGSSFDFFAHGLTTAAAGDTALRVTNYNWLAAFGDTADFGGIGTGSTIYIRGLLFTQEVEAVETFGLKWAQATATFGVNTIVRAGSFMRLERVGSNA